MTIFPNRVLLLLAFALAAATAWAQDPPARVGRLAHIENDVQFSVDRNQRSEPASINWPISSGAVLETGQRGRAEAWIGSTAYRLNERSRVEFAAVDDRRVDLRLEGGSLAVSVLDRDQAGDIAVATPDGVVRFATSGRYRIDVYADSTELSVLAGLASLDDHGRVEQVGPGQEAVLFSDGRHSLGSNRDRDVFDLWVAERENATLAGPARRHVSPRMTGYADLDAYGEWATAPDYGTVWYPRGVGDDWAPYRYGRWVWIAPWGWTWVDESPWGFAPFHYGRWALVFGRWAWIPGSYVATPVYAPALVGWVGDGGWSIGFSFGSALAIGWFPLGPREVYVPSYRYSATYIRQINVTHVRDVTYIDRAVREGGKRQFAYRTQPQAVTVVPAQKLREGAPITRSDVRIAKPAELERAPRLQQAPNLPAPRGAGRERGDGRDGRDGAGAPRSSLFGGEAARPGGERGRDFRQLQPERREVVPSDGRRGPERRQPDEDKAKPEGGRGGDVRQSPPERREAAPAERGLRSLERRQPDEDKARPEGGRGGDFRQSQPERREAAPAERGQRNFERRQPDEDKAKPEGGRGGDVRQSQPERREAAPAERGLRGLERQPDEDKARPEGGRGGDFRQSQPERREAPPPVEERRNIERPQPEAAPRREEREVIRERPMQREIEAPRQREVPRPPPEAPRAAPEAPRPAPQPMIREVPRSEPQRSEPPRMQAPPQPQGGGGGGREQKREERREERGGR